MSKWHNGNLLRDNLPFLKKLPNCRATSCRVPKLSRDNLLFFNLSRSVIAASIKTCRQYKNAKMNE
jgi:hypothetical protein